MRSYHQRITRALELLTDCLRPYIEAVMRPVYRDHWESVARESFRKTHTLTVSAAQAAEWDAGSLLTVMWDQWNSVFRHQLGHGERSLVSELREYRNRWAHQGDFDFDDTYRVLDSVDRLLRATTPSPDNPAANIFADASAEVSGLKRELLREEFTREVRVARQHAKIRSFQYRSATTYILCGLAVTFALFTNLGPLAIVWWLSVAILSICGYFAWEVLTTQPEIFSPHECARCSRIIYTEPCPYCITPRTESPVPSIEPDETEAAAIEANDTSAPQREPVGVG